MTKAEQEREEAKLAGMKAGFIAVEAMARRLVPPPDVNRYDVADAWFRTFREQKPPPEMALGMLACAIVLLAEERRKNEFAE